MKLIMCPLCNDIVALMRWKKSCKCGSVYGKYLDRLKAKVSPGAVIIATDTNKLLFVDSGAVAKVVAFEVEAIPHNGCDIIFEEFEE